MTNEEAIEELKGIKSAYSDKRFHDARLMRSEHEALDIAIRAVENIRHLKDRPCSACEFRGEYGCNKWKCIFDEDFSGITLDEQEPKTGHWIDMTSGYAFNDKCSECGYIVHIQFINEYKYCPNCGARMAESEETETWNGIHAQITAPKGTFDKIWEDAEREDKE